MTHSYSQITRSLNQKQLWMELLLLSLLIGDVAIQRLAKSHHSQLHMWQTIWLRLTMLYLMLDLVAVVRAGVVAEAPIALQELWSSLDVCFFQITLPECNSVLALRCSSSCISFFCRQHSPFLWIPILSWYASSSFFHNAEGVWRDGMQGFCGPQLISFQQQRSWPHGSWRHSLLIMLTFSINSTLEASVLVESPSVQEFVSKNM